MASRKRSLAASLCLAIVTVMAPGCATSEKPRAVTTAELPALAGQWTGTVVLPSGRSVPGTFELAPTGDYSTQAGAFVARGKAQMKGGNLALTSTSTSGGAATGQRTSIASVYERSDGMLELRGTGHSDAGPFSFEVRRAK